MKKIDENFYVADTNEFQFNNYIVTKNGDFYNSHGRKIKWSDDGVHIKLNIKGGQYGQLLNGLTILYKVFNQEDDSLPNGYFVEVIDKDKPRTKDNLKLTKRIYTQKGKLVLTEKQVAEIREKYGIERVGKEYSKREGFSSAYHPSVSYRQLAKEYNVSLHTIQCVIQGEYLKDEKKNI